MLNVFVRRTACVAAGIAMLACSDSPSEPTALEIEAAVADLASLQTRTAPDASASTVFDGAAIARRIGVRPTPIEVSVGGEVTRYHALVIAFVERTSTGEVVTRRRLMAWRGLDRPFALLHVTTLGDGGSFAPIVDRVNDLRVRAAVGRWFNLARGTRWLATDGSAKIAMANVISACPTLERLEGSRCGIAQFAVEVDGLFRLGGTTTDVRNPAVRIMTSAEAINGIVIAPAPATD
ncbi:MAG TPA: hypothetical protein VJR92_01510 [Gemmatimonadaceae bacterium]|nr:hypothetical protein [Gemmatimonadaceae bacterium]